jgi:hypothetical protein
MKGGFKRGEVRRGFKAPIVFWDFEIDEEKKIAYKVL